MCSDIPILPVYPQCHGLFFFLHQTTNLLSLWKARALPKQAKWPWVLLISSAIWNPFPTACSNQADLSKLCETGHRLTWVVPPWKHPWFPGRAQAWSEHWADLCWGRLVEWKSLGKSSKCGRKERKSAFPALLQNFAYRVWKVSYFSKRKMGYLIAWKAIISAVNAPACVNIKWHLKFEWK